MVSVDFFDWDGFVEFIKKSVREYADNLLAVIFVLVFIFAGIQRMGRL